MFNTLTVRTWDLMIPRPSWVLVTNPDRQLPCHFSKTVLRIPSKLPNALFHILANISWKAVASFSHLGSNCTLAALISAFRTLKPSSILLILWRIFRTAYFQRNATNKPLSPVGNKRIFAILFLTGKRTDLFLYKHLFQTGFLNVLQLFQLTLMKGDKGVEISQESPNFLLLIDFR